MSDYYYNGPSIDHSLLSPNGRVSKAARKAALDREAARLFPPGSWPTRSEPTAEERRQSLLQSARNLRELADRGMTPRKFRREAERLEREAGEVPPCSP